MFGQSQFVTKGTVLIIVLLFVGTAWASDTNTYDFNLHSSDLNFTYTTAQYTDLSSAIAHEMEEVMVSAKKIAALHTKGANRFKFKPEFFPQQEAVNRVDRSEVLSFDDRYGRTGFIELFRVRFGGG